MVYCVLYFVNNEYNMATNEYYREYRKKNIVKKQNYEREYGREYRQKNLEKKKSYEREYQREYRKKNTEKVRRYDREYRERHKEALNARAKELLQEKKIEVLELLGGAVCVRCGFSDPRALQIDHIGGGGNKEAIARRHGTSYYRHIKKVGGVGYQVLCANCNWIKRVENGEES